MKQLIKASFREGILLLLICLSQAIVFAQDSTVNASQSTTTTTTHTTAQTDIWYMQPWVWIAGGILFILLLLAMFRGGSNNASSTDKVTVTKTVRRESESD